ncbi:MAG: adenosine deaminase [Candidatus Acidiferrum sp.]
MRHFRPAVSRALQFSLVLVMAGATITCATAQAQSKSAAPTPAAKSTDGTAEQRANRGLEAAKSSPPALYAWLVKMPKGGDLHSHISGAVYAETFIKDAIEDRLCINTTALAFAKATSPASPAHPEVCAEGDVPAAQADADQNLYDALIDAFSMRSFVPATGTTGHDHFFDTFDKFRGTDKRHLGEWLDELATRAAAQNEQYLELMQTPAYTHAAAAAAAVPWQEDLLELRDQLLAHGLREDIAVARGELDAAEALRTKSERCSQPDAAPACQVQIRYLYQVLRGLPKETVFAQTVLAFETASVDPRFVGLNFVMPEDGRVAMTDYVLHMHMLDVLHTLYPKIQISLHAGELAPGMVPYEGLCCHIRLAVEQGHAQRIGHGVDVMYETRPHEILKEMAAKHVMVEINLTSNDVILGVFGDEHPFPIYHQFRVPVALSTDDEGVSRINLTHEFVRAVETYNLNYSDLKELVRTSLEHSFLAGGSLWREADDFRAPAPPCAHDPVGAEHPKGACADFLKSSEKATQQWELESRFRRFESQF